MCLCATNEWLRFVDRTSKMRRMSENIKNMISALRMHILMPSNSWRVMRAQTHNTLPQLFRLIYQFHRSSQFHNFCFFLFLLCRMIFAANRIRPGTGTAKSVSSSLSPSFFSVLLACSYLFTHSISTSTWAHIFMYFHFLCWFRSSLWRSSAYANKMQNGVKMHHHFVAWAIANLQMAIE